MEGRRSKRGEKNGEGIDSVGRTDLQPGIGESRKRQGERQREREWQSSKDNEEQCQQPGPEVISKPFALHNDKGTRTFRILYGNTRCVLNKLDELAVLVYEHKPEFILIAEAWSNETFNDAFFRIPAYELLCRKDRKDTTNGRGGGLLVYAKTDIASSVVEVDIPEFDSFNQCCA